MKKNFRLRNYFGKYVMSVEIVVMNFVKEIFSTYTEIRTYALIYRSTRHNAIH